MGIVMLKYLCIVILITIGFALDESLIEPIDEYKGTLHTKENRDTHRSGLNTIANPRYVQFEYTKILNKRTAERSLSSVSPSSAASPSMSFSPTDRPSHSSSPSASLSPSTSFLPTVEPSIVPSSIPTYIPSDSPESSPSATPTKTIIPTQSPSLQPSTTSQPSMIPSAIPSRHPSIVPTISIAPSSTPSMYPTLSLSPSSIPSLLPSVSQSPSSSPSDVPSLSVLPTLEPSSKPTNSISPTTPPSMRPSSFPSLDECKGYGGPNYGNVDQTKVTISFTYGVQSNLTMDSLLSEKIADIESQLLDQLILELFTLCKRPVDDDELENPFRDLKRLRAMDYEKSHLHLGNQERSRLSSNSTATPSMMPSLLSQPLKSTKRSIATLFSMSLSPNGLRGSTNTPSKEPSENSIYEKSSVWSSWSSIESSSSNPSGSPVTMNNDKPLKTSSLSMNRSVSSSPSASQSPTYFNDGSIVGISMFPPDLANGYKCKPHFESNSTDVSCLEITGRLTVFVSDTNDADKARLLVFGALKRIMDHGSLDDSHPSIVGVSFLNDTERPNFKNPPTEVTVNPSSIGSGKIWATACASLFVGIFFIGISRYRCYATFREEHGNRAEDNESDFVDVLEFAEWLQKTGQSLLPEGTGDKTENAQKDESGETGDNHRKRSDIEAGSEGASSSVSKSIGSKTIEEKKARLRELEQQYAKHASEESFAIAAAQRSLDEAKKAKMREIEELYTNLQYSLSRQASVHSLGSRKSKVSFNEKMERIEVTSLQNDTHSPSRNDDRKEEKEKTGSYSDESRGAYEESETLAEFSKVVHRDEDSVEGMGDYGEIWIDDNAQVFDDDESLDDWNEDDNDYHRE